LQLVLPSKKVGRKRKQKCHDLGLPGFEACACNKKGGKKSKKSCLAKKGPPPAHVLLSTQFIPRVTQFEMVISWGVSNPCLKAFH
jgi:hypothetical protein